MKLHWKFIRRQIAPVIDQSSHDFLSLIVRQRGVSFPVPSQPFCNEFGYIFVPPAPRTYECQLLDVVSYFVAFVARNH